ncbi:MAG: endolytic transglycosylase MltG [bacterium]|nr:endolytic transglycosylase MltG [bacterium]MBU1916934.1 endolytic transglycosylase MltG [bacterium]
MLKTLRNILIIVVLMAVVLFSLLGYKVYLAMQYVTPQTVELKVNKGANVKWISQELQNKKVIQDKYVFEYYLRYLGKENSLKAGEYVFPSKLNLDTLIDMMVKGKIKRYKITIPEGYNISQTCALFAKKSLMDIEACLTLAKDVLFLDENENIKTLEGYLFPNTYYYDKDVLPKEFFQQMIILFYEKVDEAKRKAAKEKGFTLHELVTLASIIEKETGAKEERPLIAGVFLNRLEKGMLLQSDPTVIYGVEAFDGNLRRRDLEKDTPYNTYTRKGLPIGPICSPGLASIKAVLKPITTDYLYFVAKGDGSHYFSKTLKEHNQAVQKYQLKK